MTQTNTTKSNQWNRNCTTISAFQLQKLKRDIKVKYWIFIRNKTVFDNTDFESWIDNVFNKYEQNDK